MALSGGLHAYLQQKDIGKKVNLTEESQDAKKKLRQSYSYIMRNVYAHCFPNLPKLIYTLNSRGSLGCGVLSRLVLCLKIHLCA